jgi:hypothetical protein
MLCVNSERARLRLEFVQAILGTYPHRARAIEVHRVHPVIAQRPRTMNVVLIDRELACFRIETLQT